MATIYSNRVAARNLRNARPAREARKLAMATVIADNGAMNFVFSLGRRMILGAGVAVAAIAPAAETVRVRRDIAYLGAGRSEKMDVYLPPSEASGKMRPAVVWIHGGGWTGGAKGEARAKEICSTFAQAGYVAASIDYRLGDGAWPQNLFDCKNAVRYFRAHAAEYQVDGNRIAVAGGSAGGHLALMVGFTAGEKDLEPEGAATPYAGVSSAVRCVIDLYGPTDLLTRRESAPHGEPTATRKLMGQSLRVFGASSEDDARVLRHASPVAHVTKDSPPVLILHGHADPTVDYPQSEELAAVLTQHGVEHQFILIDGVGHTFDFETWQRKPLPHDLRPVALAFLAKHLGEPASPRAPDARAASK